MSSKPMKKLLSSIKSTMRLILILQTNKELVRDREWKNLKYMLCKYKEIGIQGLVVEHLPSMHKLGSIPSIEEKKEVGVNCNSFYEKQFGAVFPI